MTRRRFKALLLAGAAPFLVQCTALGPEPEIEPGFGMSDQEIREIVDGLALDPSARLLVGSGDIARCEALAAASATADLVEEFIEATEQALVFTTGDHAYPSGSRQQFDDCYGPTWGRFQRRTRPSPGNHDYYTDNGAPYFAYFPYYERNPGARERGYYSFNHGSWHIVSLNSMLPMDEGSAQMKWLTEDLAQAEADCLMAYWHFPRFSSGIRSLTPWYRGRSAKQAWEILEAFGAELIVNGHEHLYERFPPLTSAGEVVEDGIRQFTVGTGGGDLRPLLLRHPASETLYNDGYGILVLALGSDAYQWAFVGTDGRIHDRSDRSIGCSPFTTPAD